MVKKTPKMPFPLEWRHPAGEGPRHGNRQHAQKMVNIAIVVREICSRMDRQTDTRTDVLISILCHCSCG